VGKFSRTGDAARSGKSPQEAIERLRIPYVPFWSFGEELPVIVEGTTDPYSLGRAYEILSRFLAAGLDWSAALEGQTLAPPPRSVRRELDVDWLEKHRRAALEGLVACGKKGFMEVWHRCPDSPISKELLDLKNAATQAVVRELDWPIGLVLDSPPFSPRATSEGIYSVLTIDHHPGTNIPGTTFDYWALNKCGCQCRLKIPQFSPIENSLLAPVQKSPGARRL
jgi:hypothetical protein